MFTGTKSTILVDSDPRGIAFTVGDASGVTPQTVKVSKKVKEITFAPEGSAPVTQPLPRRFQVGMLVLDILFTPGYGLSGCLIDGTTAAWFKHDATFFFNAAGAESEPGAASSEVVAAAAP